MQAVTKSLQTMHYIGFKVYLWHQIKKKTIWSISRLHTTFAYSFFSCSISVMSIFHFMIVGITDLQCRVLYIYWASRCLHFLLVCIFNLQVEQNSQISFGLLTAKDITYDLDAEAEDCYVAMEALSEVFTTSLVAFTSLQPVLIHSYFSPYCFYNKFCRSCILCNLLLSIFQTSQYGCLGPLQRQTGKHLLKRCRKYLTRYQDLWF